MRRAPDDRGSAGRFRDVLARIFGDAENPLGWALPVGRVAGIRIRLHLFFIIYVVGSILTSIVRSNLGVGFVALAMAALFLIVLLHEFGHCLACRAVGGEADDILLWPLGGLAACNPPEHWRAHLVTTLGGPAVNVLLLPILAGVLIVAGMQNVVLFNPFDPGAAIARINPISWPRVALFWTHYINIAILGFNLLLPVYPLDGGRILHSLLWARSGRVEASHIAVLTGLIGSGVLAVAGLVLDQSTLIGVAIFTGVTCALERSRLRAADELSETVLPGPWSKPRPPAERVPSRAALRRREREARERAELDRILDKIARDGLHSLSRAEKRFLRRTTDKQRKE